jgi:hypothetical protein
MSTKQVKPLLKPEDSSPKRNEESKEEKEQDEPLAKAGELFSFA